LSSKFSGPDGDHSARALDLTRQARLCLRREYRDQPLFIMATRLRTTQLAIGAPPGQDA